MDKILIDTDVILDVFFNRKPFVEYSSQVIGLCEAKKIKGYLTPVIYSNLYYLLRQRARHDKIIDKLKHLLTITDVLSMDSIVVKNALNSEFKDFEYSLQNFAAMQHGEIAVIVTRNIKDYKKSKIGVLTPETYIKSLTSKV